MILSNTEIIKCLKAKSIEIDPLLNNTDPDKPPFNTSSIDLRLGNEILVFESGSPVQLDLREGSITNFLVKHTKKIEISEDNPYSLQSNKFILAKTLEKLNFPLNQNGITYSARVEGKSSLARCGILVHFTAPTIHAGFSGTITLEIINLGEYKFLLTPSMYICQLIIEEVKGSPTDAPNQFKGQTNAAGVLHK